MEFFFGPMGVLTVAADDRAAQPAFGGLGRPGVVEKEGHSLARLAGQLAGRGGRHSKRGSAVECRPFALTDQEHLFGLAHRHQQRRGFVAAPGEFLALDERADRAVKFSVDFGGRGAQRSVLEDSNNDRVGRCLRNARFDPFDLHCRAPSRCGNYVKRNGILTPAQHLAQERGAEWCHAYGDQN